MLIDNESRVAGIEGVDRYGIGRKRHTYHYFSPWRYSTTKNPWQMTNINSIRIKRRPFYSRSLSWWKYIIATEFCPPARPLQLFSQSSNEDLYYPAARARTKPLTVKGQDVNQGVRQLSNRVSRYSIFQEAVCTPYAMVYGTVPWSIVRTVNNIIHNNCVVTSRCD